MGKRVLYENRLKRPLALFVSGFMTALAVLCFFMENAGLYFAAVSLAAILISCFTGFDRRFEKKPAIYMLGIFAASLLWIVNIGFVYNPAISIAGKKGELTGYVQDYPQVYDDYTRIVLKIISFSDDSSSRMKVCVYLDGDFGFLKPGDCITLFAGLDIPHNSRSFASRRYLNSHGIFLTASAETAEVIKSEKIPISARLRRIERYIGESISKIMPEKEASMLTALIFGDESGLSDDFSRDLRAAGLSHITAVSGMNVAFLCAVLVTVFGKKAGSVIGIPAIAAFMLMTGCSASVMRAGIMQMLLIIAYFISREADSLTSLAAAALVILLMNPFSIADTGFLLSFFATLGLILCAKPAENFLVKHILINNAILKRIVLGVVTAAVQTLAAQLFILPIQALCFGELSLIAPLSNAAVLWATEYAFVFGIAAAVSGLIWLPLGVIAGFIPRILCLYILKSVSLFASIPYASICAENIYVYVIIAALYITAAILIFTGYKNMRFTLVLFSALCVITLSLSLTQKAFTASAAVVSTVSGQSTVIRCGSDFIVIGAGGSDSNAVSGLEDFLWKEGCRKIDILVVSSYRKADTGNVSVVLKKHKVAQLLLPEPQDEGDEEIYRNIINTANEHDTTVQIIRENTEISMGKAVLTVFVNHSDDSDRGRFVIKAEAGGKTVMALGAIQPENLGRILFEENYPHVDILALGDYYSAKAIPGAVKKLCPEIAVLSSFNAPTVSAVYDLSKSGAQSYFTERKGYFSQSFPLKNK